MAVTETTTKRRADVSGDDIKVVTADGETALIQMVALADNDGNQMGVPASPMVVTVTSGGVSISSVVHKFGTVTDLDAGERGTIWDGAGKNGADLLPLNGNVEALQLSSSNDSDTATVYVEGLGTGSVEVSQSVALTGRTPVALPTNMLLVHRMYLDPLSLTEIAGDVYCSTDGAALSSGVPSTPSTVRAVMQAGVGATQMAVYGIPTGKVGYVTAVHGYIDGSGEILLKRRVGPGYASRSFDTFLSDNVEIDHDYTLGGDPTTGIGPFGAGSVIEAQLLAAQANTRASFSFTIALVETDV